MTYHGIGAHAVCSCYLLAFTLIRRCKPHLGSLSTWRAWLAWKWFNVPRICQQHDSLICMTALTWHTSIAISPITHRYSWRRGNWVGRINEVTLRRAKLVLGWVTCPGSTPGGGTFFRYVTSHPGRLSLSRSINWVVSCNRMIASSHRRRHLVNAYRVKAWCGRLER